MIQTCSIVLNFKVYLGQVFFPETVEDLFTQADCHANDSASVVSMVSAE